MSNVLDQWHYFVSPIYSTKKPEFLDDAKAASMEMVKAVKKNTKVDDIYPVVMADISSHPSTQPLLEYIINTAWNLLSDQGYDMANRTTYFTEAWCQEHHKYSSMEHHIHNDSQLVAFYFIDCPKDSPKLVIHDPRPAKTMLNLPETDATNLTMASTQINFTPEPGLLMFANSWLPHSFTRNPSNKPFTFIHMNISTRMNVNPVQYEPTAEII